MAIDMDVELAATVAFNRLGWEVKNYVVNSGPPVLILAELHDKIYFIECMREFNTYVQYMHLERFGKNLHDILEHYFGARLERFDLKKQVKPMFWLLEGTSETINAEYEVLKQMAISDQSIEFLFGERKPAAESGDKRT